MMFLEGNISFPPTMGFFAAIATIATDAAASVIAERVFTDFILSPFNSFE